MDRRVAHVLRKFDPEQWGGTETHVAAVTRRLGALGWRAEVHAPVGPAGPPRGLAGDVPLRRFRAFLPVVGSRAGRAGLVANGGNLVSLEECARLALDARLDLVHAHTLGRVGGAVRTASRLAGRPYVVSVHGPLLADPALVAATTARRLAGLWDWGQPFGALLGARRVLDDAARVIAFNDDEHRAVAARVGPRAVRMDHGVDAPRLGAGDAGRARARWPRLGDAPVVVVLGRLCEQKNQVLAVRAFARGAPGDHRLALAGAQTDRGYRARVEREARALGVADRVHLLGNLDPGAVPDLLARSALVLAPSTHEAFGLCVLEAWAAGRAALFPNHTGLADIARRLPDATPALPTLDEGPWAAALARFLADGALRGAAAAAGLALVRARYTWEAAAAALAALYDEVLAEARARRTP